MLFWLVVSTHLKNISQIGSSPQVGIKKKIELAPPSFCQNPKSRSDHGCRFGTSTTPQLSSL